MGSVLEMRGIRKSFYGVEVLHGVDFSIEQGEAVALCGENGAGKSTMMKVLMGIYKKDGGEILFEGKPVETQNPLKSLALGLSMIHQELNLVDQLTIAQNIFLGREPRLASGLINYKKMNEDARKAMEMLQEFTPVTTPVGQIKVAQKQIVEIARAISCELCKVIIMDEPTAVLTDRETAVLFDAIQRLKKTGIAIIYISHRLAEIKHICDKVTILRDGNLVAVKQASDLTEHEIANLMVGRELTDTSAAPFTGDPNNIALEVKGVSDSLLKDVSFQVRRGEILGFSGLVGAGRTELMEFIYGLRKVHSGEVYLNGTRVSITSPDQALMHNIGFATEDRKLSGIIGCRSISENMNYGYLIKFVKAFVKKHKISENYNTMRKKLNIVCSGSGQLIKNLSGGNQQKVVLAKWLLINSEILILDEPTRGIDVGAREEIYQIIYEMVKSGKTVLIVSSDLPELLQVCPRILVMYEGRMMGELIGDERTEHNIITLASGLPISN